jgi:hypothetical protein
MPKLSADDIERLFDELRKVDATYGRTLAETTLDGADPWAMARRYARAFTHSLNRLTTKNPRIARTLPAAACRSRHPVANALEYLSRFDALIDEIKRDEPVARTVAKAAFIAPDRIRAARRFIQDDHSVAQQLTTQGSNQPLHARWRVSRV